LSGSKRCIFPLLDTSLRFEFLFVERSEAQKRKGQWPIEVKNTAFASSRCTDNQGKPGHCVGTPGQGEALIQGYR